MRKTKASGGTSAKRIVQAAAELPAWAEVVGHPEIRIPIRDLVAPLRLPSRAPLRTNDTLTSDLERVVMRMGSALPEPTAPTTYQIFENRHDIKPMHALINDLANTEIRARLSVDAFFLYRASDGRYLSPGETYSKRDLQGYQADPYLEPEPDFANFDWHARTGLGLGTLGAYVAQTSERLTAEQQKEHYEKRQADFEIEKRRVEQENKQRIEDDLDSWGGMIPLFKIQYKSKPYDPPHLIQIGNVWFNMARIAEAKGKTAAYLNQLAVEPLTENGLPADVRWPLQARVGDRVIDINLPFPNAGLPQPHVINNDKTRRVGGRPPKWTQRHAPMIRRAWELKETMSQTRICRVLEKEFGFKGAPVKYLLTLDPGSLPSDPE